MSRRYELIRVPGTIDLPLSVVTDMMFLPYTIAQQVLQPQKQASSPLRIVIFVLLFSVFCTASYAAELSPSVEREIATLLDALGASKCLFYRNGSWHSASDAQTHLARKYEYLRKNKLIGSSEDFIANGGTKNSRSGEAYQVQCGRNKSVPSSEWLSAVLHRLRSSPSEESSGK